MSRYFLKNQLTWTQTKVRNKAIEKCSIWVGSLEVQSGFYCMPKGMSIPEHTHSSWVQVVVLEGEMQVETKEDGKISITAGGCYFVEPGDTHRETAVQDTLVLVTDGED